MTVLSIRMNKSIFLKNSISSLGLLGANILFSLFFTSYYVRTFGVESFSFLSLLIQFSAGLTLICSPFNTVLARFVILDESNYQIHYRTVFCITFLLSLVVSFVAIYFFSSSIDYQVDFLFFALGAMFLCFSLIENCFLFISGKLYIQSSLQILNVFFRVLGFFILANYFDSVLSFSLSFFMINLMHYLALKFIFCKKMHSYGIERKAPIAIFDFKLLLVKSKYLFLNSFGAVLIRNIDIVLILYFLTSTDAGIYALYLQIVALVRLFTEAFSTAIAPKIMRDFIKKDNDSVISFNVFLKIIYFVVALTTFLVFVNISFLWKLWVGDSIDYDIYIIGLLLLSGGLSGGFYAYVYVQNALDKNKVPSYVSLISGFAFFLGGAGILFFEFGLDNYALYYFVVIFLKNVIFSAYYNSVICNQVFFANLKSFFAALLPVVFLGFVFYVLNFQSHQGDILFIVCQIPLVLSALFLFYKYSFRNEEKHFLKKFWSS